MTHVDVFLTGAIFGLVLGLVVDRWILIPVATWLERVERRWNGRPRPR